MKTRNRKRLPTIIQELKGAYRVNPGRRRQNEPQPSGELGNPPASLAADQQECWAEIAGMIPDRVLTNADRWLVETAVVLMAEFRSDRASFNAAKIGRLVDCLGRMGLTPADRARISIPPGARDDSPWDGLKVISGGKETA